MNINGNHWLRQFRQKGKSEPKAEVADELIKKSLPKAYQLSLYTAPSRKMVTTAVCSYAYTSGGACVRKRATTKHQRTTSSRWICCAPW
ncbi:hypothetical protein GQ600_11218 [Phytophthora cactorum]|nr:hypothetical protein GQ600_11218 [Phytophthora cactorum]